MTDQPASPTGMKLASKVAIVTGGGRGIGRGIAGRLASEGAAVLIAQRDPESAHRTVAELIDEGFEASFHQTDVGQPDDVYRMVDSCVERYGGVDILVNNAGLTGVDRSVLDMSLDTWKRALDVNLTSIFVATQAAARAMVAGHRQGSIINIASINSYRAQKHALHYVATKGAVPLLTMGLAVDLAEHGIRVNAIAPGMISTERTSPRYLVEENRQMVKRNVPLGRTGTTAEVAALTLFLVSDECPYINGETILIDGGFTGYLRFD